MKKKQLKKLLSEISEQKELTLAHNLNSLEVLDTNFKKIHKNNKLLYYFKIVLIALLMYNSFIVTGTFGIENLTALLHLM